MDTMPNLLPKQTYEHNRLDETSDVDKHRCHNASKFGVFVDEDQNFINDYISGVLLQILDHVLLPSCLYV